MWPHSPFLALRVSESLPYTKNIHLPNTLLLFLLMPTALQVMQLQNFITLKSALLNIRSCSSYLSHSRLQRLTKAALLLAAFEPGSSILNNQPSESVDCAFMMLLVSKPSSPFPASTKCSASSTWALAQSQWDSSIYSSLCMSCHFSFL